MNSSQQISRFIRAFQIARRPRLYVVEAFGGKEYHQLAHAENTTKIDIHDDVTVFHQKCLPGIPLLDSRIIHQNFQLSPWFCMISVKMDSGEASFPISQRYHTA